MTLGHGPIGSEKKNMIDMAPLCTTTMTSQSFANACVEQRSHPDVKILALTHSSAIEGVYKSVGSVFARTS
jgi:hypothetical protein